MRNKLKKLMASSAVVVLALSNVMNVSAETLKDCFDAEYYSSTYEDLQNAFGDNENALYKHYLEYGIEEGRQVNEFFDVKVYRERYADLDAAFGDDWDAYYNHYLTYGLFEGRSALASGEVFDATSYANLYSDLKAAFGDDVLALYNHYITYGIAEGRVISEPVVVQSNSTSNNNSVVNDSNISDSDANDSNVEDTDTNDSSVSDSDANDSNNSDTENNNESNNDGEESGDSSVNNVEEWIDNLYNSLLQDDYETVMTLLENLTNVREKCADYEYTEWAEFDNESAYKLTADDGTIFGIVVYENGDYWDISAFVSDSDDVDYGFEDIGKGDHFVEMIYNQNGTSYNYIQEGNTVVFSDGSTFALDDVVIDGVVYETTYIVWHM